MPSKVDDLVLRLEALLFASGKPLSTKELTEALDAPDFRPVQRALRQLIRTYDGRQTALEVRHVGDRFALQLREKYVPAAHGVTPVEMPPRTLKALTLIAYHQPILQSLLVRMLGEAAYEKVSRLRGLNLIHADPKGSTLELRTTKVFAEYFGIASTKPEEIRSFLEKKLGVTPSQMAVPPVATLEAPTPPPELPTPPPGATDEAPAAP
jgi:segregation and condensation protein B